MRVRGRERAIMTALRCVIDMTIRLGGVNCKGALSYWGRLGLLSGEGPETGRSPVSPIPPGPRHSRESGNLLARAVRLRESGNLPVRPTTDTGFPPTRE